MDLNWFGQGLITCEITCVELVVILYYLLIEYFSINYETNCNIYSINLLLYYFFILLLFLYAIN